jgi:16S rRNA G527 N7-methylase RsmG
MTTASEARAAAMTHEAWVEAIARALPAYGYAVAAGEAGERTIARLAAFLQAIVAGQSRARLVGSLEPEALVRRHLGESLYLGAILPLARQRLVDVGAGAGFPGLALALGWPELSTTLVEATAKKAAFLQATIAQLGWSGRARLAAAYLPRHPSRDRAPLVGAEVVTARALEHMEQLPAWLGRWLDPGTQVALWTSAAQAGRWRTTAPGWSWGAFHRLPGADTRGILLGAWPGR